MGLEIKKINDIAVGRDAFLYTLRNSGGMTVSVMNYGGVIVSIKFPDKHGNSLELMPGFDSLAAFTENPAYFGALIGRVANRIQNASFTLEGQTYSLEKNFLGRHNLHSGPKGFSHYFWDHEAGDNSVKLKGYFMDGAEGFPGDLEGTVEYSLDDSNTLRISYDFSCNKSTLLNITSHPYFNLNGEGNGDILDHELQINSSRYLVSNADSINTGELSPVEGGPFDFKRPARIGERIHERHPMLDAAGGYDLCYALDTGNPAATAWSKKSGIKLGVSTSQPGLQLYTGNSLDGTLGKSEAIRHRRHGYFCLETQHFPGAENIKSFPSIVLKPGQTYKHFCAYQLSRT